MYTLDTGRRVLDLKFLPDSRRIFAILGAPVEPPSSRDRFRLGEQTLKQEEDVEPAAFEIWPLPDGDPVRLNLPRLRSPTWWYMKFGAWTAIDPNGERCYIAWNGQLFAFDTANGAALPVDKRVEAHQVVVAPDGEQIVTAYATSSEKKIYYLRKGVRKGALSRWPLPDSFRLLCGFTSDSQQLVTIESGVHVSSIHKDGASGPARTPKCLGNRPVMSPDGRYLGAMGYSSMYIYDLVALGKPKRISGSQSFGDFRSIAFHPDGKRFAVIHSGPTLVKIYDYATIRRIETFKWKVGELDAVAYSPDGMLAAAGGREGRLVIWDVEE